MNNIEVYRPTMNEDTIFLARNIMLHKIFHGLENKL